MWQLLLIGYYILGATSYLLRRVLAQKFSEHNRLINGVFYVFFLLPLGLMLSQFFPHNLNIGWTNALLLVVGGVIWPVFNIIAFRANQEVDVGIYSVINNLSPLFTLMIALPFLGEHLSNVQFWGIFLLIASGVIAAYPKISKNAHANAKGLLYCLLATAVLGFAVAYERFMLTRVDFGTYVLFGWGAQIVWSAFYARKEWKYLPSLIRRAGYKTIIAYGSSNALKSACFILALLVSGSAAVVGAATDFMAVVVVLSAYVFLHERDHLAYKLSAAAVGIAGLLLVTMK